MIPGFGVPPQRRQQRCCSGRLLRMLRRRRRSAVPAEAAHARLPASWLPASGRHGFCPCRPRSADRAARLPGTANPVMSDARGRSMASPAVLIRAD